MKQGHIFTSIVLTLLVTLSLATAAHAQGNGEPFKGKLFPPNQILENQAELNLSREQFTEIRAAVVEVQANVAEHEWDMREAYLGLMAELDARPIDEDAVLDHANTALLAENQVKLRQMRMLIQLRNLLNDDQIAYLEEKYGNE